MLHAGCCDQDVVCRELCELSCAEVALYRLLHTSVVCRLLRAIYCVHVAVCRLLSAYCYVKYVVCKLMCEISHTYRLLCTVC